MRRLDRLVDNELIFRRGAPPDASYTFKHALVRDAAANSLLRSEFRRINAAIVAAFGGGRALTTTGANWLACRTG